MRGHRFAINIDEEFTLRLPFETMDVLALSYQSSVLGSCSFWNSFLRTWVVQLSSNTAPYSFRVDGGGSFCGDGQHYPITDKNDVSRLVDIIRRFVG